ncbi:MAG: response regulator [Cecembia sp.]
MLSLNIKSKDLRNFLIVFSTFFFSHHMVFSSDLLKAQQFFKHAQYDSAYLYGKRSFDQFQGTGDSIEFKAAIITGISMAQEKVADSLDYIGMANLIATQKKNPKWIAEVEYAKGKLLYIKAWYSDALPYFLRVDSIGKHHSFKNITTVEAIIHRSEISRMAFTNQAVNAAYSLMLEALAMAKEINEEYLEHVIYMQLSDLNGLRENYQEAKSYADIAFDYFIKINDVRKVSRIYWIYASYYNVMDDLENCEKTHKERLDYLQSKNDAGELASALTAYGNFLRRSRNDCSRALGYFDQAKKLLEEIKDEQSDRYLRLVLGMAICYADITNYKQAYELYDLAYGLKVDAMQKANQELTRNLETKYQFQQKEKEIELLSAENQLSRKQQLYQRNLFLAIFMFLLFLGIILFYGYRNKIKTAKRLQELDEMKSSFFANISHEFRTPLSLIKSPVHSILKTETSEETIKKLRLIDNNADHMLTLVDQLLELSKLDGGSMKLILKKSNLTRYLRALAEPFGFEASQKGIGFLVEILDSDETHWFDKDVITKIISNLFSNAIKYTSAGNNIHFLAKVSAETLQVKVQNTGVSLTNQERERIFERFYQKSDSNPGAGIGLALTQELVHLYNGKISVSSSHNEVTFTVHLPLDPTRIPYAVIIKDEPEFYIDSQQTETQPSEDTPLLLIAEDNPSISQVLKELFGPDFHILLAKDGKEAHTIALEKVPDIIISDVMMPGMNGFEFSKAIKESEVTSHIPLILLTARAGDQAHLEGLKSLADAFLTKPFNNDILRAKVNQLIQERIKLRERYSQELVLRPKDIVINSADEKFLLKLQQIIDSKLENPQFSTEDFAIEVGMSRMQLHRKLKSLTGLSATEFIRSERLKMALPLLEKGNLNISEVAYTVGFNDVSYFTKCFKERYQVTPSEFGKGR